MTAQFTWEAMSFLSKYGMLLDQDRLEDWVELFEPQAEYKVYSRENEELGLPAPLMWCDNRAMLSDRIQSYRNVNEHNFHWARHIIGIDLLEDRLKVSPKMGATATVCNSQEDPVAAVKKILNGNLPDIVIECVGHADQQMNLCFDLCKQKGELLCFGVPPQIIDGLRWRDLFYKNVTVHTSVNPDFRRDFPLAMQWIAEGRINVAPIITHRFPLAQLQEAFELFRDRRDGAIKVIVEFPSKKPS